MIFNPDHSKPAQEVIFSRKKQFQSHPTINLDNIQVERASYQKHLGIILDEKLNFKQHVGNAITICWKFSLISGFFVFSWLIVMGGWNQ